MSILLEYAKVNHVQTAISSILSHYHSLQSYYKRVITQKQMVR